MRLPIDETRPHKDILVLEPLNGEYPQIEHKELKRSDSEAIAMHTKQSFQQNQRPNTTSTITDTALSNENNEKNNSGNTYHKILLTPQDQYIRSLPKVIISASASVTDASGKKLNYSVGNVIASNIKLPPSTYDEYHEEDVSLDPFFIDVPKIAPRRSKRDVTAFTRATTIANISAKNN